MVEGGRDIGGVARWWWTTRHEMVLGAIEERQNGRKDSAGAQEDLSWHIIYMEADIGLLHRLLEIDIVLYSYMTGPGKQQCHKYGARYSNQSKKTNHKDENRNIRFLHIDH